MAQQINPEDMKAFAARAGEGPVAMLNLLAFVPDGGAESYAAYAEAIQPLLRKAGAQITYMGAAGALLLGSEQDRWDLALVVQYPTRGAFLGMVSSTEYQAIKHLRDQALSRSVLLATDPRDTIGGG